MDEKLPKGDSGHPFGLLVKFEVGAAPLKLLAYVDEKLLASCV